MQKSSSETDLKAAIQRLENQQAEDAKQIKMQLLQVRESIRPINLVKSAFADATSSETIKGDLLRTSAGLATGLVSKALFVGISANPIKKMVGNAIVLGITSAVAKNPSITKTLARGVLRLFGRKAENGWKKV